MKNKILESEKYTDRGYMGIGELNHILLADYQDAKGHKYCNFFIWFHHKYD